MSCFWENFLVVLVSSVMILMLLLGIVLLGQWLDEQFESPWITGGYIAFWFLAILAGASWIYCSTWWSYSQHVCLRHVKFWVFVIPWPLARFAGRQRIRTHGATTKATNKSGWNMHGVEQLYTSWASPYTPSACRIHLSIGTSGGICHPFTYPLVKQKSPHSIYAGSKVKKMVNLLLLHQATNGYV